MKKPRHSIMPTTTQDVVKLAIIIVLAISILNLIGWMFNIPLFKSIDSDATPMRVITSFCLILSGIALFHILMRNQTRLQKLIPKVVGATISTVGFFTVAVHLHVLATGTESPFVNRAFFNQFLDADSRMALITAFMFVIIGIVLFLLSTGKQKSANIAHALILPVSVITYLILMSYILGVHSIHNYNNLSVAINTDIAFFVLCFAVLFMRTDTWFMKVFINKNAGGEMARKLLPILMVLPPIIGWGRIYGEQMSMYRSEVGVIFVACMYAVCFIVLVWITARSVNRTDYKRQQLQDDLIESDQRLAVTLACIGDAVISTDVKGNITFLNAVAEELTGWTSEEAMQKPVKEVFNIINEYTREIVESPIPKVLELGLIVGLANHTILIKKDGSEIPIDDSGSPIKDRNGNIIGAVLIFRDFTERKDVERKLKSAADEWQNTFDSISDLVSIQDKDFRLVRVNKSYEKAVGLTNEQLVGTKCFEVIHKTSCAINGCPHAKTIESGKNACAEIYEPTLDTYIEATTSPILNEEGEVIGTVHIAKDITQRKQAEMALNKNNRTLKAKNRSSHQLFHAKDEVAYINEVCKIIVEDCGYKMVWVGYAEYDEQKTVKPIASYGFEDGYVENLNITWSDTERGRGPTGTAIRTGVSSMCKDMLTDPAFEPWREEAVKRGYAASLVLPLKDKNHPFGALTIYAKEADPFSDEEIYLLSELANDLAFGIKTIRNNKEKEKAQKELKESDERLHFSLKASIIGAWDMDLIDHTSFRTIEHDQIFGYKELLPSWTFEMALEHMVPEDREDVNNKFTTAIKNKSDWNFECRIRRADDNSLRWIFATGRHQLDDKGNACRMAGIVQDITLRKQAENAIKESEERLHFALEAGNTGAWEMNLIDHTAIQTIEHSRIFGYNELLPNWTLKKFFEHVIPEDREQVKNAIDTAIDKKSNWNLECRIRRANDNNMRWISLMARLQVDNKGNASRVVGIVQDITLRKQAEEAIQKSEERLHFALEAGNTGAWEMSLIDHTAVQTIEYARIFGYNELVQDWSLEKTLGHVVPEDREFVKNTINSAIQNKKDWNIECRIRRVDNALRWVSVMARLQFDSKGNASRVFGIVQDITTRKQTEEIILKNEQKLKYHFENSPLAVVEWDNNFIVTTWSKEAERMFGWKEEETIGKRIDSLNMIFEDDIPIVNRTMERLTGGDERMVKSTNRNYTKSGEIIHCTWYNSILLDEKGQMSSVMSLVDDITARKQAEVTLKKNQEIVGHLASIVRYSEDAIISKNLDGTIRTWNKGAEKMFGYTEQEAVGADISLIIPPEHVDEEKHILEIVSKDQPVEPHETIRRNKNGETFPVSVSVSPLKDYAGKVIGVSKIARNISDQKRIENELIQAKEIADEVVKAKQQFLANMSHEIRTPMTAIIGFTKVVLNTELTPKQREYLAAIKISGDALLVLINDILDLAKVDAGKMTFEHIPFKMSRSLSAMLHLFDSKIQEKNLKLIKEYDYNIPEVLVGDPVRLHQIILNLVSNAVKFTSKGSITVSVRLLKEDKKSASVEFVIADTGIGIETNKLEDIFANFQQASCGTSRIFGGTGLGLAIVKQLVERQGGTISVKSKVGEGSTFSFVLHFQKTKEVVNLDNQVEEAVLLDDENKTIKVLVAEDMVLNQLLIKTLLKDFGFERDIADNGKIAIDKLQEKPYDIILMDLQMPEMNGFETTAHIRNTMKSDIPIIALTADVTTTDLAKCRSVGMNDYIAKPIDEKLLYNKIIELVNKKS